MNLHTCMYSSPCKVGLGLLGRNNAVFLYTTILGKLLVRTCLSNFFFDCC